MKIICGFCKKRFNKKEWRKHEKSKIEYIELCRMMVNKIFNSVQQKEEREGGKKE